MKLLKKKANAVLFFLILISLTTISFSLADEVGCCINLGAGALVCSLERLALRDKECCPRPETNFTQYYKSAQNPNSPTNYNDCTTNYFFANTDCSIVNSCTIGCCCSGLSGTIKSKVQCQGAGLTFFEGETDCSIACPTPQCNDGIDNDNNGCADFNGGDLGCSSSADTSEADGTCSNQNPSCSDISYTPKLSSFTITPAKGQKKFFLMWQDECNQNTLSYEISRCKGDGCSNFALVGTASTNSFEDSSDELQFDTTYTYQVKARYSPQVATPTITKTANLGNAQCFGHTTNDLFCLNNEAFYCDSFNILIAQGTKCSAQQVCTVEGNRASCLSKSTCNNDSANPFAMYNTITGCEVSNYCFYDRSHTTVDSCFPCDAAMSCYDYRTEKTCARDNCNVGNCKWKSPSSSLGIGVCISSTQSNCQWCDTKGTRVLQNSKSFNEVFDICTKDKSDALSEGEFKCYFNGQGAESCGQVTCADYDAGQCSNVPITHDENNNIVNPSNDQCGIKVCQNINALCAKNADGDSQADCTTTLCEKDYFKPITTLSPVINSKNILQSLIAQINDKTSSNGSEILRTTPDYLTYLCVEPCGESGHPYNVSSASRSFVVSNLKIFDSANGKLLLTMKEGFNVLRYYSQDPSKNLGMVKKITVEAHSNTTGPKLFNITVTDGNKVGDKIYTKNQKPIISVQFYEPAVPTFARMVSKDKKKIVNLQFSQALNTKIDLTLPEVLSNGEYTLELNAKNSGNIFMDPPISAPIIIDNIPPKLNITPSNGTVLTVSSVLIILSFDKEVTLERVILNSEDIKDKLSTLDNKLFSTTLNLTDGPKTFEVSASSYANNQVSSTSSFTVDAVPTILSLVQPKFGVSSTYVFDLKIGTDNDAECRYALDKNFEFDFMESFTTTGGTTHTAANFNKIPQNDTSVHKLNVRCKDPRYGESFKTFDLSVDTTQPSIKSAFAFPNPIIEKPATTTLTVETDEPTICKYSASSTTFDSMDGKFSGFENNTFKTVNKQNITLESAGNYNYKVACRNKADLVSSTNEIIFTVDFSLLITITSHTPEFFGTAKITLAVETNKKAQCLYSETDHTARNGELFSTPAGYIHQQQLDLSSGKHTFYIVCKDQYLQSFSEVATVNFTIDVTAPVMLFVNDTSTFELYPEKTCLNDRLRVKFLAEDQESRISEYFYALFKRLDNKPLLNFIQTFIGNEWVWVDNLNLSENSQYYFGVKSNNVIGLQSAVKNSDGITVDKSICQPTPVCGDSLINLPGEECDRETFGTIYKCTQYTDFIGGILKCTSDCKLDPSECIRPLACGNGHLDPGETCDGSVFGAIDSCTDYSTSFSGGTLRCTATCQLDTSNCVEKTNKCGNGAIDKGESCDGTNLGPLSGTCIDYKQSQFTGGNIGCSSCKIDTSQCQGTVGTCGDSTLNIGEACDGNVFGAIDSCTDYSNSFSGGTLRCTSTCQLDTTGCTERDKCGNTFIDKGETCDTNNLGPISNKCVEYSQDFNNGTITCKSDCRLDTFGCTRAAEGCGNNRLDTGELCDGTNFGTITDLSCKSYSSLFINGTIKCVGCSINTDDCVPKPIPKCGDGIINVAGEQCDKETFGIINRCTQYTNFVGGTLRCDDNCLLDTSGCIQRPTCGNAQLDPDEDCDGNVFGAIDRCNDYSSFSGGTLRCTQKCELDTSNCIEKPKCGNAAIDKGESCDGTNLGPLNGKCIDYKPNIFTGGNITCNGNCQLDTSKCQGTVGTCGDSTLNIGEACDGSVFGAIDSCTDYSNSFSGGTLRCTSTCQLDTSSCIEKPKCGNGIVDRNESCDTNNFGINSSKCIDYSLEFSSGTLECINCNLDTSKCVKAPTCGNNKIDAGEFCDGTKFLNITDLKCSSYSSNFVSGNIKCTGCQINTNDCAIKQQVKCGDGIINQPGEQCDMNTFGSVNQCTQYADFIGGTLKCTSDCKIDTSSCTEKDKCGNGAIDKGESCDGTNLGPLSGTCIDYKPSQFTGGNIGCSSCKIDTSQCQGTVGTCGDNTLNIGEACDGNVFGAIDSCTDYSASFSGGTLRCTSTCQLDTTGCTEKPKCGNGNINTGEICDGNNFGNIADLRCKNYSSSFVGGSISCAGCQISTSNCLTEDSGTKVKCKDRGDCGVGEACTDNSDCGSRYCVSGQCTQATCSDNVKNQGESSVDCGGPCGKCANGKSCNTNGECQSDFCYFGTCKAPEVCLDSRLSPGEADIDCGGICPTKCSDDKNCDSDQDCLEKSKCKSSKCTTCEIGDSNCDGIQDKEADSDGDGLPDQWEIENGMNPNDPSDANNDPDNDGLTNYEEYEVQRTHQKSTDPNNMDTDNDGFSDKEELDKGTNPLDPEDFPKSSFGKTILIVIGILALISGFGYLAYSSISKKRKLEMEMMMPRTASRIIPQIQKRPFPMQRQIPIRPRVADTRITELLKKKQEEKQKERENLLEAFGKKGAEKPVEKPIEESKIKEKESIKDVKKIKRQPTQKKPKEDTFIKLQELVKESKKEGTTKQK